jgi:hypothetical protein
VDGAVGGEVLGAVGGAVDDAVDGAVDVLKNGSEIASATREAISQSWGNYFGGQFWVGGWYWGGAWTSYFREVAQLELAGDIWDRARAYEGTMESACWWWPHRRFVMVCERPTAIHRELANPLVTRGWGSHRLHRDSGPAIVWPDGWGLHVVHGVRVTKQIVDAPETLTPEQITSEPNAEVRRIMLERFGTERYIRESGAKVIDSSDYGTLYRAELGDDEPLVMVCVTNSSPEPDGAFKDYWLRVPPTIERARDAVAWTFGIDPKRYELAVQT